MDRQCFGTPAGGETRYNERMAAGSQPKFPSQSQLRKILGADARFLALMKEVGPFRIELDPEESVFEAVATSIIYQQLQGKAAASILAKFKAHVNARNGHEPEFFPSAREVLEVSTEDLRSCGLSGAKTRSLQDLAEKVLSGTIPSRSYAEGMSDQELIDALVAVRGVGPWTAQMVLMFTLGRMNVWPTGDYGVRKGFAALYGKHRLPTPKELEKAGEKFQPYRTAAAWYLWRALELPRLKKWKPREE